MNRRIKKKKLKQRIRKYYPAYFFRTGEYSEKLLANIQKLYPDTIMIPLYKEGMFVCMNRFLFPFAIRLEQGVRRYQIAMKINELKEQNDSENRGELLNMLINYGSFTIFDQIYNHSLEKAGELYAGRD